MNDALQTTAVQWATQLELAIKEQPFITAYDICIELSHTKSFINELDNRNRWGKQLQSSQDVDHRFQIRLFLQNGKFAFLQDTRRFADNEQTPHRIIEHLLEDINQLPNPTGSKVYQSTIHQLDTLEIWDPRFELLDASLRKELLQEHYTIIPQMNKRARLQRLELKECQLMRYSRSNRNSLSEQSTQYELNGLVATGIERIPFHMVSRRFADLCTHPFGWTSFYPPPVPSKTITEVSPDWMLMLSPQVVADIVRCLPPAFELERLEKGTSFLSGKQGRQIGSKRIHLIDDPTLPSGVNSRGFDALGVPSKPLTLISDGVFQDCYIPLDSNRSSSATGHSNMDGTLWAGNLLSQMGRRSQNMILADKGEALLATHTLEPVHLNIETGMIKLVFNIAHLTAKGFTGSLGVRTLHTSILDLFAQVSENANDQNRYGHVDASTWVLEDCRLLSKSQ